MNKEKNDLFQALHKLTPNEYEVLKNYFIKLDPEVFGLSKWANDIIHRLYNAGRKFDGHWYFYDSNRAIFIDYFCSGFSLSNSRMLYLSRNAHRDQRIIDYHTSLLDLLLFPIKRRNKLGSCEICEHMNILNQIEESKTTEASSWSKWLCFACKEDLEKKEREKSLSDKEKERLQKRRIVSAKERILIFQRDNFRCRICGQDAASGAQLEIDHITPYSKDGLTCFSNLQTLCSDCNSGKGTLDLTLRP